MLVLSLSLFYNSTFQVIQKEKVKELNLHEVRKSPLLQGGYWMWNPSPHAGGLLTTLLTLTGTHCTVAFFVLTTCSSFHSWHWWHIFESVNFQTIRRSVTLRSTTRHVAPNKLDERSQFRAEQSTQQKYTWTLAVLLVGLIAKRQLCNKKLCRRCKRTLVAQQNHFAILNSS